MTFIRMLHLPNRKKFCSVVFTAARLCSSCPPAACKNPVVYFDIAADNEPLGRISFEVSRLKKNKKKTTFTLKICVKSL